MRGELFHNYPLARHTSWRVGGNAERCYRPRDLVDLQQFLKQLPQYEPLVWLGLGSNVLIRDNGIAGTVIFTLNRLNNIHLLDNNIIYAEAGVTCAKLAKYCVQHGFEDGAFLAGIPGTVGGALAMNAGAFGSETWQYVNAVDTIDRQGNMIRRMPEQFNIAYRQVNQPEHCYFSAGYFEFKAGSCEKAQHKLRALLKKRNYSQPIGTYSCGSVFRNPPDDYAARLIDQAGLKGHQIGDARVSEKHANFILNQGSATASDIEKLMNYVKQQVYSRFTVDLLPEVHIIG